MHPVNNRRVQDLASFTVPRGFRGRSALVVQLWYLVQSTLFRWSPQVMYGFRSWLLRCFGAKIGKGVRIRPSMRTPYPWKLSIGDETWISDDVVLYTFAPITIGRDCVVSQRSYLCAGTHDYQRPTFDLQASPIIIEDEAWLATDVFVAPGVTIGTGAVIGSRSSVYGDMPAQMICVGSPARPKKPRL